MNVEIFRTFELRLETTNILVTRDNILHRKRIYLQKKKKNESSIFKHNVNPLSVNPAKWSNTLKQQNGQPHSSNCLSVFDHFVGLALKGLR